LFLTILTQFIEKTDSLELLGGFDNAVDAYNFLQNNSVDLVFLDIEMPEMTGLELLKSLEKTPQIIIVSSEQKYVIDAFELNVSAYLLKPLDNYAKFLNAVKKAKTNSDSKKRSMFIKEEHKLVKLNIDDIMYIEAYGDYIKIYTEEKFHITYASLKDFSQKLPCEFVQIHRSYIVSLHHVDAVDGNMLSVGKKQIPMSRSRRDDIMQRLQEL
ncbi:response regulator transcription factor, partial [Fulvivirga sp. RKSG066]|uniref:LytR/AlgR family response regulator transcription factor n=1 Tax=Fulvivirga aurantia TaxID=2529383 RepID=UPI0012BBC0B7